MERRAFLTSWKDALCARHCTTAGSNVAGDDLYKAFLYSRNRAPPYKTCQSKSFPPTISLFYLTLRDGMALIHPILLSNVANKCWLKYLLGHIDQIDSSGWKPNSFMCGYTSNAACRCGYRGGVFFELSSSLSQNWLQGSLLISKLFSKVVFPKIEFFISKNG